jgi:hypothetical protein
MDIRYLLVLKKQVTLSILLLLTYLVVIDFFKNRVNNLPSFLVGSNQTRP